MVRRQADEKFVIYCNNEYSDIMDKAILDKLILEYVSKDIQETINNKLSNEEFEKLIEDNEELLTKCSSDVEETNESIYELYSKLLRYTRLKSKIKI